MCLAIVMMMLMVVMMILMMTKTIHDPSYTKLVAGETESGLDDTSNTSSSPYDDYDENVYAIMMI